MACFLIAMAWFLIAICTLWSFPWYRTHLSAFACGHRHPTLLSRGLITACSLESASGQSGKTPDPYLLQQFSVKFGIIILFWSEALLFVCHTKEMGTSIEEAGDLCLWSQSNLATLKRNSGPLHPGSSTVGIEEICFFTLQSRAEALWVEKMNGIFDHQQMMYRLERLMPMSCLQDSSYPPTQLITGRCLSHLSLPQDTEPRLGKVVDYRCFPGLQKKGKN